MRACNNHYEQWLVLVSRCCLENPYISVCYIRHQFYYWISKYSTNNAPSIQLKIWKKNPWSVHLSVLREKLYSFTSGGLFLDKMAIWPKHSEIFQSGCKYLWHDVIVYICLLTRCPFDRMGKNSIIINYNIDLNLQFRWFT